MARRKKSLSEFLLEKSSTIALVLFVLIAIFLFIPSEEGNLLTGRATIGSVSYHVDQLELTTEVSRTVPLSLGFFRDEAQLVSFKLSGSFTGEKFSVYLSNSDGDQVLVLNTDTLRKALKGKKVSVPDEQEPAVSVLDYEVQSISLSEEPEAETATRTVVTPTGGVTEVTAPLALPPLVYATSKSTLLLPITGFATSASRDDEGENTVTFNDLCVESCELPEDFGTEEYALIIRLSQGSELTLDSAEYGLILKAPETAIFSLEVEDRARRRIESKVTILTQGAEVLS